MPNGVKIFVWPFDKLGSMGLQTSRHTRPLHEMFFRSTRLKY